MIVKADTQPLQPVSYTTTASCHCGKIRLPITLASQTAVFDLSQTWQKLTGTLVVFYSKLSETPTIDIARTELSEYVVDNRQNFIAYFCKTCSAHVCFTTTEAWFVHTATLGNEIVKNLTFQRVHSGSIATSETDDAKQYHQEMLSKSKSLAECLQDYVFPSTFTPKQASSQSAGEGNIKADKKPAYLHGSCHCGSIQLCLTRPTAHSYPPYAVSPLPDFLQSFYETPTEEQAKPAHTAWWIIDDDVYDAHDNGKNEVGENSKKFIAAFCSCTSCRKIAGSELQQWTFLPEGCLSLKYKLGEGFVAWPNFWPLLSSTSSSPATDGDMTVYGSSGNVIRGSCRVCGASIFWNGRIREKLVDISVGLFLVPDARSRKDIQKQYDCDEGIVDGGWFKWSIDRLSFVEHTKGRTEMMKDLEVSWRTAACGSLEEGNGKVFQR